MRESEVDAAALEPPINFIIKRTQSEHRFTRSSAQEHLSHCAQKQGVGKVRFHFGFVAVRAICAIVLHQ